MLIAGDGNYALQPWLMTPIPPGLVDPGTPEERYNDAHAKALGAIDQCIASMRATWRILSRTMDYEAVLCANVVNACCVLHNMRCAGNAPRVVDAPKRKRPTKKRKVEVSLPAAGADPLSPQLTAESARLEEQVAALQERIRTKEQSEGVATAPVEAGQIGNVDEQLRAESSRLEEQIAALQEQMGPVNARRVLGNQAAAWNILANKAALVEDPSAIVFDPKNGGRKSELDLARRLQAKLVAQHFSQPA